MDQLSKIGSLLDENLQSLMLITHNNTNYPASELVSHIEKNAEEVNKIWSDYVSSYLTPEEKELADNFAKERHAFLTEALKPSLALARAGKIAELSQLIDGTAIPFYQKMNKSQDDLLELQMRVAKEEYEKSKKNSQIGLLATIGGIFAGVIIAFAAIRGILKHVRNPLGKIKAAIEGMSRGDYSSEVSVDSEDEFGEIVMLFKILQSKVVYSINETKEKEIQNQQRRKAEMRKVADDFQKQVGAIVDGVCAAASELQATAESMAAATEETSKQSNTVAAAAEQASANVQTVASAAEELSVSVKEIQGSVSNSNSMVARAADQAAATNGKVKDLATASQKIGEVVSLINDIAAQTNLLALNATIEAARAGDAGKGFAVVASEVKALAGQTAKATEEIAKQVQDIQSASSSSAAAIQQIAHAVEEVKKSSTAISAAVEEQGATTREIARNVNEAAMGTKEVSSNIAGVSQAAQHTGVSATQVLSAASELAKNGEKLRVQVDQFLSAVRAA
jgi:methyl-accepting chemotaxis protein